VNKASRFLKVIQLKNKQRVVDNLFEKEGLSDEVLSKQVEINILRNELDMPDSEKVIFEDFVQ